MPFPAQHYLPLPMYDSFDSYLDGPILEDLQFWVKENMDNCIRLSWDYFKDYGYRLLPDFTVIFNQQNLINIENHLFPVGKPQFQDFSFYNEMVIHYLFTNHKGKSCQALINNVNVMGMGEMLKLASDKNSPYSIDLFICKKNSIQRNYVCF